tara:strand:+ start:177 stop:764 length:588 start_codon:yes stop_codon:yes gene_type:complete
MTDTKHEEPLSDKQNGYKDPKFEIEIIQNYLPENEFSVLYDMTTRLPWVLSKQMNPNASKEHHFAFIQDYSTEHFRNSFKGLERSVFNTAIAPYCKKHQIGAKLHRVRTNLYIKTLEYQDGCGMHEDSNIAECFTLLLYMEDSDGATEFKKTGKRVISERNKAIIFPANEFHQTISQTNVLFRMNLNINFFKTSP